MERFRFVRRSLRRSRVMDGSIVSAEIFAGALAGYAFGADNLPVKTRRKALTTGLWASAGTVLGLTPILWDLITGPAPSGFFSLDFRSLAAVVLLFLTVMTGAVASSLAAIAGRVADPARFLTPKAILVGFMTPTISLQVLDRVFRLM